MLAELKLLNRSAEKLLGTWVLILGMVPGCLYLYPSLLGCLAVEIARILVIQFFQAAVSKTDGQTHSYKVLIIGSGSTKSKITLAKETMSNITGSYLGVI